MKITDLIPERIQASINGTLDLVDDLLQGESVLLIGNVAGIAVYAFAKGLGAIPDVSLADAVLKAGGAITLLNGVLVTIRKYVYSQKSVAKIVVSPGSVELPTDAIAKELDKTEPVA